MCLGEGEGEGEASVRNVNCKYNTRVWRAYTLHARLDGEDIKNYKLSVRNRKVPQYDVHIQNVTAQQLQTVYTKKKGYRSMRHTPEYIHNVTV